MNLIEDFTANYLEIMVFILFVAMVFISAARVMWILVLTLRDNVRQLRSPN